MVFRQVFCTDGCWESALSWMRLKSGGVWTGMILQASHNFFVQDFLDRQTRHLRFAENELAKAES